MMTPLRFTTPYKATFPLATSHVTSSLGMGTIGISFSPGDLFMFDAAIRDAGELSWVKTCLTIALRLSVTAQ